jgi:hypothetical protein
MLSRFPRATVCAGLVVLRAMAWSANSDVRSSDGAECVVAGKSNEQRCGPVVSPPQETHSDGYSTVEICFEAFIEGGDSGSPAWIEGTGAAVGIMTSGFGQFEGLPKEACFEALKPYPGWPASSAVFTNSGLAPLHLAVDNG